MIATRLRPALLSSGVLAIVTALAVTACDSKSDEAPNSVSSPEGGADKREDNKAEEAAKSDAAMPIFAEDGGAAGAAEPSAVFAPEPPPARPEAREEEAPPPGYRTKLEKTQGGDGDGDEASIAERYFTHYGVNPTIETRENPFSTFGVDVDTAAYVMARSYLDRGELPPEDAIRVEEVVNYFDYHYAPPEEGDFSLHAEVVPSPQREGYHLLHLGVKGKEISAAQRPDANLVFVIDVSGSMGSQGRLQLVKDSLRLLVDQLRATDRVGVVVYGSSARVVLPPTPGSERSTILAAIDGLGTEGSTNVEAGLRLGYEQAQKQARGAGINRVVLCSDGVANTGATTADALLRQVEQHAAEGITITTIGVGMGSYNDTLMEQLADKGNGNYSYVDDLGEARRVFVDHLT
ncbi:MAG: von Willebrand factor type A domain-containing protein, partial [Myxococcales bacterium]|nr:von Willebrand factor type A domain-containing protein [Myxococcales bacterium]